MGEPGVLSPRLYVSILGSPGFPAYETLVLVFWNVSSAVGPVCNGLLRSVLVRQ